MALRPQVALRYGVSDGVSQMNLLPIFPIDAPHFSRKWYIYHPVSIPKTAPTQFILHSFRCHKSAFYADLAPVSLPNLALA